MEQLLVDTDWNKEWIRSQTSRKRFDNASNWDARAANFSTRDKKSDYAAHFIKMADLQAGESVFDMGCGNGALAIPLAEERHPVLAADFSSGMLSVLEDGARAKGLSGLITTKLMAWDDNWQEAGIEPKSIDVCFASRSIATLDLKASLEKLSQVARRKVCITLSTGASPRTDESILHELGIDAPVGRDYWYAINILIQMGIKPELRYIESRRADSYDSMQEAYENYAKMVDDMEFFVGEAAVNRAKERLVTWLEGELIENPMCGKPEEDISNPSSCANQKAYKLKTPRVVRWAFISWNV